MVRRQRVCLRRGRHRPRPFRPQGKRLDRFGSLSWTSSTRWNPPSPRIPGPRNLRGRWRTTMSAHHPLLPHRRRRLRKYTRHKQKARLQPMCRPCPRRPPKLRKRRRQGHHPLQLQHRPWCQRKGRRNLQLLRPPPALAVELKTQSRQHPPVPHVRIYLNRKRGATWLREKKMRRMMITARRRLRPPQLLLAARGGRRRHPNGRA